MGAVPIASRRCDTYTTSSLTPSSTWWCPHLRRRKGSGLLLVLLVCFGFGDGCSVGLVIAFICKPSALHNNFSRLLLERNLKPWWSPQSQTAQEQCIHLLLLLHRHRAQETALVASSASVLHALTKTLFRCTDAMNMEWHMIYHSTTEFIIHLISIRKRRHL